MLRFLRTVPLLLTALLLVRAHTVRADELVRLFQDSVVFTNVGYTCGAEVISNFPLRVDISAARPYGFDYDLAGAKASTLRFNYTAVYVDHKTNATYDATVNYAVTNWNTAGESTLYVQLPFFSNNPTAKLTMYWNPVDYAELPLNDPAKVSYPVYNPKESSLWNKSIGDQASNPDYIACGPAYRRVQHSGTWTKKLLNYWLEKPALSKNSWKQGEASAVVNAGISVSDGATVVSYIDRSDNSSLGVDMPVVPGSYRAVVTVVESDDYAPLEYKMDFTIVSGASVSGLATTNDFANTVTFVPAQSAKDNSLAAQLETKSAATNGYTYRAEIAASGAVSMGGWFKFNTASASSTGDHFFLFGLCGNDSGEGPLAVLLNNQSAVASCAIRLIGYTNNGSKFVKTEFLSVKNSTWRDGKWHMIMATRRQSTGKVRLYLDGALLAEADCTKTAFYGSGATPLGIGCDPVSRGTKTDGFNGYLADVQLYSRELDVETISGLYTSRLRLDGNEAGLIACYPMNDEKVSGAVTGGTFADINSERNAKYEGKVTWGKPSDLPFLIGPSRLKAKPFLVKLSEGYPSGFSFDSLRFGKTAEAFYSDVRFYDEWDRSLDYEIYSWNPSGETYVWVKVPNMSASTRITMCWNQGADTLLPANHPNTVWEEGTEASVKEDWKKFYLSDYDNTVTSGKVAENPQKRLQNRWIVEPSLSYTQWKSGDAAPRVTIGASYGGAATVAYFDRTTGTEIDELPTSRVGEYRAVFTFAETPGWSALEKRIDFRIVDELGDHDLGDVNTRLLLANNDGSISGAEAWTQSYDDNEDGWGVPYWTHHEYGSTNDVSDLDSSKLFADFNLFAGTCHEYMSGKERIWGLVNVRFGNLFNNGRIHPDEQGTAGLKARQNYLPWNPDSERMLGYQGLRVGQYHRYVGNFLLQNVCDDRLKRYAEICSPCYNEGIGTVYFDVVNAFTDNVRDEDGNANYAIVVEIATNITGSVEKAPVDGPDGIWSVSEEGEIYDAYRYADWHAVAMHPIRFHGNSGKEADDCDILPATTNLELEITSGGSLYNFYRVYVPVDLNCPARFRIRRTRIDESASFNPDADAFIIVDNLICSRPRELLELKPYGHYDSGLTGKQYLGQEAAFSPAFPGPKDAVMARVKAVDRTGAAVPEGKITAVTMHYRWHYLEQRGSTWQAADFDPATLTALQPLVLPGLPGDIEFWFEGAQNCGYYSYANYSGTKVGVPGYSEAFALLTNGWNGVSSEWNLRIREGSSDVERAVMIVREPGRADFEIPMELVEGHQWRGYYQTTNSISAGAKVRFELRNRQKSGADWSWNTNCLYCAEKEAKLTPPFSGKLKSATTNEWTHVPVDAGTGYLMFQLDDSVMGLTLVRADYQNFNRWTDGYGDKFVGTAADESGLPASGVSPLTRDFTTDYRGLDDQIDIMTNGLWNLDFETRTGYTYYKTFQAGTEVVNGWKLGKGRYVYGAYRMPGSGTAFQMSGGGEGYVEMSDSTLGKWPRGIEKVTFSAHLAQSVEFDDVAYADDHARLTDYAFTAHVAFDHDSNLSFTGNASLSLFAYYRRGVGAYEARWEQIKGKVDTRGVVTGPDLYGQKLSIYRWNDNGSGIEPTLLYEVYNGTNYGFNFSMPAPSASTALRDSKMLPISIAAYKYNDAGDVMIVVGIRTAGNKPTEFTNANEWRYAAFLDNSSKKLTSGSYGVLSANCSGYFLRPMVTKSSIPPTQKWGTWTSLPAGGKGTYTNGNYSYPFAASAMASCKDDISTGFWRPVRSRSKVINQDDHVYGFEAGDISQTVELIASTAEGDYTEKLASYTISNHWGRINAVEEFGATLPLVWRAKDTKFRLRTGGDLDRATSAVVVDNVKVHQWRGRNQILLYDSGDSPDSSAECKVVANADPGNFVYTGGIVKDLGGGETTLELSAKRTIEGRPTGVRTPLMDALSGRGSGIGNISFAYRNAQPNVALLVQVATNIYRGNLPEVTVDSTTNGIWTTVARLDYSSLGSEGTTNIAFGIRNRSGAGYGAVARVILDPELVLSMTNVIDTARFGVIDIDYVTCQDEPPIDKGCWWGWNLRTLGNTGDTENRMYLPDASMRPDSGYSLALNNSITEDIVASKSGEYYRHMPFLQTPSFTNNLIGQVTFRARKYGYSDRDQAAEIALYGITESDLAHDGEWKLLTRFAVSNAVFTAYSYRVNSEQKYCAFRFGVTGVKGVDPAERGPTPLYGSVPVRVMLDEVVVSEAINPELAFRSVGAFRSDMSGTRAVEGVPGKSEQPLAGEGWGVQCELYAVMLEEEIDQTKPPRVKLYWYEGDDLWGYDRWKSKAHSAWLARAADTDSLVYRSGYENAPEAVIPMSTKESGGYAPVVQYMLEVYYTIIDPKTGAKIETSRPLDVKGGEWTVPSWYAPVDYNNDPNYGAGSHQSCYCILDDLAPGWAWINEVNIFSDEKKTWDNDDINCQYVEIAAPRDIDLSGWRVEMVGALQYSGMIITNTIATFGTRGLSGTKSLNAVSNYVFHVIANPDRLDGNDRSILQPEGALDGTWNFENPGSVFQSDNSLDWGEGVGIRLVRANGIVEHQIVTVGTNIYVSSTESTPTGVVAYLNAKMNPKTFFHPGQDSNSGDHSVGVVNEQGGRSDLWNNTMTRTPGKINEGQQINPDYPLPIGEMMPVYFDLDRTGGDIWQSFDGGLSFTNESKRMFLRIGTTIGTNVLYKVAPWYEFDYVREVCGNVTKYFDVITGFDRVNRTLEVTVGKGCSNRVNVVARAMPDRQLRELGCDEKNIYTKAVIDWLQKGETLKGSFAKNDGIIRLAQFWGLHSGFISDLSLTEMYWLDIDPTVGEMVLRAGMSKPPTESLYTGYAGSAAVTNLKMSVFMMITNTATDASAPYYGQAWSPYVLRGVEPGDTSLSYTNGSGKAWESATFKISGILPNGHTSELIRENWVDLRWFFFTPDSFYQPSDEPAHQRFTTDIEIRDPVNDTSSPGYGAGWYDWVHDPEYPEHSSVRPFFRWGLDTRLKPFEVEVLKKNNYYP